MSLYNFIASIRHTTVSGSNHEPTETNSGLSGFGLGERTDHRRFDLDEVLHCSRWDRYWLNWCRDGIRRVDSLQKRSAGAGRNPGGIAAPSATECLIAFLQLEFAEVGSVISLSKYSTVRTSNGRGESRLSSVTAKTPKYEAPAESRGEWD